MAQKIISFKSKITLKLGIFNVRSSPVMKNRMLSLVVKVVEQIFTPLHVRSEISIFHLGGSLALCV